MKYCIEKNLRKLQSTMRRKKLFESNLKDSVFLCVLEILYNISNRGKGEKKLMPRQVMRKIKSKKQLLRYCFSKDKTVKKRKKRFLREGSDFQELIEEILSEFFKRCVVSFD